MNQLGLETGWTLLHIVLPVGISFYTFQAISYVVDIKKGKIQPTEKFTTFGSNNKLITKKIEATNLFDNVLAGEGN